jgi:hypothetical protein
MFDANRHLSMTLRAMLTAVLVSGSLCSVVAAQEKGSTEAANPPQPVKEPAKETTPERTQEPTKESKESAEPAVTPASSQDAAPTLSPFRAVAEKAASLPTPPPRKERSLYEISQQQGSAGTILALPRKDEPERRPATLDNLGNFQHHWQVFAHFRGSWVSDPNLDPFAADDFLPAIGAGGGRVLYGQGQLSLAALAFVEASGTEAQARGATSNLDTVRLGLGPEVRYHFIPRSYLFVRAFPELMRAETSLEDPNTASTLEDHQWAFAADLGAGIAFNAAGQPDGEEHQPRLWVILEGGYGLTFLRDLKLTPQQGEPAPARVAPLVWDAPSLNAPLMRISAAMTL